MHIITFVCHNTYAVTSKLLALSFQREICDTMCIKQFDSQSVKKR